MRKVSIFGRTPGALALGASVCTLALAGMAGTANAALITIVNVAYSAPQKGQGTSAAPVANSCYVNFNTPDIIDCQLINPVVVSPALPNPQWKAGSVGDLTLLNVAGTVSDTVRFCNVNDAAGVAQANIFFFSEESGSTGVCAAGTANESRNEFVTLAGDPDGGIAQTARQVDVVGASPVRLRIQSDLPTPGDIVLAWY